jgi:hypothetical protein
MWVANQSGAATDSASRAARRVWSEELQAVHRTHRREHMSGIGALPTSGLDYAEFGEPGQQQVQNLLFQSMIDQPLPEPGQHRVIEPRISQLQTQGVLPVDSTPYGVRGLPIGQVLSELQDRDQRQLCRRDPRLAPHPKRRSKLFVGKQPW